MTTQISSHANAFGALFSALLGSFRHWRLILIAWFVGLFAATFIARPVFSLLNTALGQNPDAERIVSTQDAASIIESVMTLGNGGGMHGGGAIAQGLMSSLFIALLLTPWLTGMLVASLREGRALHFGELWLGGWREYGRQFRLLLVGLIPWAAVVSIAILVSFWAHHGNDTRILESVGQQRNTIAMWVITIAGLLVWTSIEAGRAAFAADNDLRSAFRAWLRGLKLMLRRPLSVLFLVLVTVVIGGGLTMLLQQPAMRSLSASGSLIWMLAQLAVLAIWWMRITRLTALTAISPLPVYPVPAASSHETANIATDEIDTVDPDPTTPSEPASA